MGCWCKTRQPLLSLLPQARLPGLDTFRILEHARQSEATRVETRASRLFCFGSYFHSGVPEAKEIDARDAGQAPDCEAASSRIPCQNWVKHHVVTGILYYTYRSPSHPFTLSHHVRIPNDASNDGLNLL